MPRKNFPPPCVTINLHNLNGVIQFLSQIITMWTIYAIFCISYDDSIFMFFRDLTPFPYRTLSFFKPWRHKECLFHSHVTFGVGGFSCAVSGFGKKKWPASPLVSSAEGRGCVGLRAMKLLFARAKKPLVPRVVFTREETSQLNW